jgi:fatty acid desaturase
MCKPKQIVTRKLPPVWEPAARGAGCLFLAVVLLGAYGTDGPPAAMVLIAVLLAQVIGDGIVVGAALIGRRLDSPPPRRRFRYSKPASSVRESWRRLPAFLQPLLTCLSGKPLDGEEPRDPGPYGVLWLIAMKLVAGVSLSVAATGGGGGWLLLILPGCVLTVSAFRHLALTVIHETAGHDEVFTRDKETDRVIGETAAVLSVSQNYDSYKTEHKQKHHGPKFMTEQDPTVRFLIKTLGITRGMSRLEAWARLLGALFTPWYQIRQTVARVKSSWTGASQFHRRGMLLHLAVVAGLGAAFPATVLVAWVLPLLVTNLAIAVRMCLEHVYPPSPITRLRSPEGVDGSTHAMFFGIAAPSSGLPWYLRFPAWGLWTGAMVGFVLPCKMVLAPGGSAAHDYHHAKPVAGACPDPVYARQQFLASRSPDAPPLTEVWGAAAAIDDLFASLTESIAF